MGGPPGSRGATLDPLHAVYVAVQNVTSVFAERVSVSPVRPLLPWSSKAEETYMPCGPPMSPLTGSYFTTWAFFDLRFGPDQETIGTCLLDVGELLGLGPEEIEVDSPDVRDPDGHLRAAGSGAVGACSGS